MADEDVFADRLYHIEVYTDDLKEMRGFDKRTFSG